MPDLRSASPAKAITTILFAVVALWLLLKLLGVALKLVGLLILGGIAVAAYFAVTRRIEGPGGDA